MDVSKLSSTIQNCGYSQSRFFELPNPLMLKVKLYLWFNNNRFIYLPYRKVVSTSLKGAHKTENIVTKYKESHSNKKNIS